MFLMVDWTDRPVPAEHMTIMCRAARMLVTEGYEEDILDFDHDLCSGRVRFHKLGTFGGSGGAFFEGDFGEKEGRPNKVAFFIPRHAFRAPMSAEHIVTRQAVRSGAGGPDYPEDVDMGAVMEGDLRIRLISESGRG